MFSDSGRAGLQLCVVIILHMCVSLCSHVEKITTWQDPRKTMAASMNQMSLHAQATSNNSGVQARSMALSQPNLGENLQLFPFRNRAFSSETL